MKQDKATFTHTNAINLFIVYEPDTWSKDLNTKFVLSDCLFETVKLAKNADPVKYGYSGCGIEIDASLQFSLPIGERSTNVVNLGMDNAASSHTDNRIIKSAK